MAQPPGFPPSTMPHHVCNLLKAVYGLKQALCAWYQELKGYLLQVGFIISVIDASLFIYNKDGATTYFLVYVDDIILADNNTDFLNSFVKNLDLRFSHKDLGPLYHFLPVEVSTNTQALKGNTASHLVFMGVDEDLHSDLLSVH
ncbi:hypothetical protein RJ640_003208 [Escallonia rubra]|uniref:Reverse transcriptase Ty1/copia-type domain-containing protein n=1 Tax=Escallonia rubra TaxID=112253 RepID=A0AA88R446_9ASTE|nr:hypothetical protein RJ640_003208 [Escallonia rubra]